MIILLLYVEAHIFILETLNKIRNLISYDACSTIIHALINCRFDYCGRHSHLNGLGYILNVSVVGYW